MKSILVAISSMVIAFVVIPSYAGHHGDSSYQKMKGKHQERMAKRLKKIDTDGDGKMSRAEFLAHAEQRFAKMDSDGDGFVTKEEGKAAHKKMRKEHKKFFKDQHSEKTQSTPE